MRPGWVRFPHVPAIFFLFLLYDSAIPGPTAGQEPAGEAEDPVESVVLVPQAAADSLPPISPFSALIRSLVIPGWGQASVGRPERGAIYFAAGSAALVLVFQSQSLLNAARRSEPVDEDLVDSLSGQKETRIVWYGFIAFFSALDAWVSTHFWHFEPEVVMPDDGGVGVQMNYSVPIGFP